MEDRIAKLEDMVMILRDAYYNGQPEVSDQEYDALEAELRSLAPNSPALTHVGAPAPGASKWEKTAHTIPMGSLNKGNSIGDIRGWAAATGGLLFSWSEKMDGISIALYYEGGNLVRAVTRGDGAVGENIMANVVMMRGAPRILPIPVTGVFRGEIVLTHDFFAQQFPDMANPRNAASGLAKTEDRGKAKRCEYLTIYMYEAFVNGVHFEDETEKFLYLKSMDFYTPNHGGPVTCEEIEAIYNAYAGGFRAEIGYDIDGLVIRHHKQQKFEGLGERNNRPYGAIALKFEAEAQTTVLREVLWQVGTTGRLTPVGVFDPVSLAGATVARASLYNAAYIRDIQAAPGDRIMVVRANDVIPRVEGVVEKMSDNPYAKAPDECPECGSGVEQEGEYLQCPNMGCPARVKGNIKAWVQALDLLDWGDGVIEALVSLGKVRHIPDLYALTADDLAGIENSGGARLGKKTASKLVNTLHAKRVIPLDTLIEGLNIPMTRGSTARLLMAGGMDTLEKMQGASLMELSRPKGMGGRKAQALYEGLQEAQPTLAGILQYVTIDYTRGALQGVSVCLTGAMGNPRKVIEKMVKDAGGVIKSGVSADLSYLVCNDPGSGSSKAKKARQLGTPIIHEDELYRMLGMT